MRTHAKTGIIAALTAALLALTFTFVMAGKSAPAAGNSGETVLQVSNLSCGACAKNIESELRKHQGLQSMSTDLATGRVTIRHTAELTSEQLAKLVTDVGYPATIAASEVAAGQTGTPGCRGCVTKEKEVKNCNAKNCTAKECDPKKCDGKNCDPKNCEVKNCTAKDCAVKKSEARGCTPKGCKLPAPAAEKG